MPEPKSGLLRMICRMSQPLLVARREFSIEDPWRLPDGCDPVTLRRSTDGGTSRLATRVALCHDGECLTALFLGDDDGVTATHLEHDAPLYEEDVVEIFVAPDGLTPYFEIEVSPLGTTFDARINSPDGVRATMRTDVGWTCDGLFAGVRRTPASLDVVIRVPFASLGAAPPRAGDAWRANLFRIDRHPKHGSDFSAWQPTMKQPADFHVARAFGTLLFE